MLIFVKRIKTKRDLIKLFTQGYVTEKELRKGLDYFKGDENIERISG